MPNLNGSPRLVFEYGFNDQDAYEAEGRGYLSHVSVDVGDGSLYPVVFYDAVRLQQDIDEEAKAGKPYLATPGMIVLAKVTLENMQRAVVDLYRGDFFSRLVPQSRDSCAVAEP